MRSDREDWADQNDLGRLVKLSQRLSLCMEGAILGIFILAMLLVIEYRLERPSNQTQAIATEANKILQLARGNPRYDSLTKSFTEETEAWKALGSWLDQKNFTSGSCRLKWIETGHVDLSCTAYFDEATVAEATSAQLAPIEVLAKKRIVTKETKSPPAIQKCEPGKPIPLNPEGLYLGRSATHLFNPRKQIWEPVVGSR